MEIALFCFLQDNPEQGVLYLLRGLLNVLQDYVWDSNTDAKARIYISVLAVFSAMSQEVYPYHIYKGTYFDIHYSSGCLCLLSVMS